MAWTELTSQWSFPNDATPLGSDIYYAIRFAPTAARDDLALLAALRYRIFSIPSECSEPAVALQKARWWREELTNTTHENPSHPLTRQLARLMTRRPLPSAPLLQMADAVIAEIEQTPFPDVEALAAYCSKGTGALCELFVRAQGTTASDDLIRSARRLGGFIGMAKAIQDMGAHLRAGRCFIPDDLLQRYGIRCGSPMSPEHNAGIAAAAAQLAKGAKAIHQETAQPFDRRLLPPLILARLAEVTLRELEKGGFPVAKERLSLTPLRKLWLSWRLARKAR